MIITPSLPGSSNSVTEKEKKKETLTNNEATSESETTGAAAAAATAAGQEATVAKESETKLDAAEEAVDAGGVVRRIRDKIQDELSCTICNEVFIAVSFLRIY